MTNKIQRVNLVSDGILVELQNGTACYFSTDMLLTYASKPGSSLFLNYDPSEVAPPALRLTGDSCGFPASGLYD